MAIINKIDNLASITYRGNSINSNTVSTLLLLAATIIKAVDKATAFIGDLTYMITITNLSLSALPTLPFTDTIAQGMTYNTESFSVNGAASTITGNTSTYTIPAIPSLETATIQFKTTVVGASSTS